MHTALNRTRNSELASRHAMFMGRRARAKLSMAMFVCVCVCLPSLWRVCGARRVFVLNNSLVAMSAATPTATDDDDTETSSSCWWRTSSSSSLSCGVSVDGGVSVLDGACRYSVCVFGCALSYRVTRCVTLSLAHYTPVDRFYPQPPVQHICMLYV